MMWQFSQIQQIEKKKQFGTACLNGLANIV